MKKALITLVLLGTLTLQAEYITAPDGSTIWTPDGEIYSNGQGGYQGIEDVTVDPEGNAIPDYDTYYEDQEQEQED